MVEQPINVNSNKPNDPIPDPAEAEVDESIAKRPGPSETDWKPDWRSLALVAFKRAFSVLRNTDDAMDISQASLAALFASDKPPDNPEAWVTTVTTRLALNELRRRRNSAEKLSMVAGQRPLDSEEFADRVAGRLLIDEVLKSLPPRQREALDLRFRQDLSSATVAKIMNISAETVKTHIERAREAVRRSSDARDE